MKNYISPKNCFNTLFVMCFSISIQAQSYTSWKVGSTTDVTRTTTAGICLMGGGLDNDDAIKWMFQKADGGDVVVLRSAGTDGYNAYMYSELGVTVNSVETIIIDTRAKANITEIATKIRNAEALFIAGGDQATYVSYWKDTPIENAINYLINIKKVPVGGTSAGCAILGKYYFSAATASILSAEALANPYNSGVTIGANDFINSPILANTITDTHYNNPDRRGRQTAFLARMWKDLGTGINAKGIGVYEKTAVCIDQNGIARVFAPATTSFAYFYQIETNSTPETVVSSTSLTWNNNGKGVKILKIAGNTTGSTTFDLNNWITTSGTNATWGNIKVINGTLTEILGGSPPSTVICSTPTGINSSSIGATEATISWISTGATNYTVRYKVASNTTWTTLANTTATSVLLSGLTIATLYNVEVVGNCISNPSTAGTISFSTIPSTTTVTYCASKGNNANSEWLSKVAIGNINNTSGKNRGYGDFSALSTEITKGVVKILTLTPGFSVTRDLYWKVYVDYNNNGMFTDSGENIYSVFSRNILNVNITVPSLAVIGSVRMRIIVSYNSITSPCGIYNYGETEDYTLNINASTAKINLQANQLMNLNNLTEKLSNKVVVTPNPISEDFDISFNNIENEKIVVKIYSAKGKEEKSFHFNAKVGKNVIRKNRDGLAYGQYILKVFKTDSIYTTKFLISN